MMRCNNERRDATLVSENVAKARLAADTALSTSAALPSEMVAICSAVAGFVTAKSQGAVGAAHSPSM